MYELKPETMKHIADSIEKELGIPYEIFVELDYDDQRTLIEQNRRKRKNSRLDEVIVMIGSGERSFFTKVKKGDLVSVGSGEESCFVRAGISPEESRQELDDRIDDALYSKPVAFVKKIQRRIKNKKQFRK